MDSKTRSSKQGVVCWWESELTREQKAVLLIRHGQLFSIQQTIDMRPTAFLVITLQTPSNITFTCIIVGLVHAHAWTS